MKPLTPEQVEKLSKLAARGATVRAAADQLGVTYTQARRVMRLTGCIEGGCGLPVKSRGLCWHHYQNVRRAERAAQDEDEPTDTGGCYLPPQKPNPMGTAKRVWQGRLDDTGGCLRLDGRPVRFDELMRKTNAALVAWGMEPLTANPAWMP